MPIIQTPDYALCKTRRAELIKKILDRFPEKNNGIILLLANFESDCAVFKQERSFYYLTGIEEPASACTIDLATGKTTLYVPNFGKEREKWVAGALSPNVEQAQKLHIDEIAYTGSACKGYQCHPFFSRSEYETVLSVLTLAVEQKRTIFTCNPALGSSYIEQRFMLQRMQTIVANLAEHVVDISPFIASMRRKKHTREIECLYKAIDITLQAHDLAAQIIKPKKYEYQIQAGIEYIFTSEGGSIAFPSIVATGKNATTLHYHHNNTMLEEDDVIVVDIGAAYNYYCADITRTYPVSGAFTKRQRELYTIVLDTQDYIAQQAKPGMWLNNAEHADKSLNHLARQFLKERNYEKYFIHGIGHFLGLEVHDVGDYAEPLQVGDVITIEPGLYIPEENIGIRIEDDYWIVQDGSVSLSENLPKDPDEVEAMMQEVQEEIEHVDEQSLDD